MKIDTAPLQALLLAGGHSRRMGKDKSALLYQGQTQLARTIALLQNLSIPSCLSLRAGQPLPPEAEAAEVEPIHDKNQFKDIGPLGGILSAFAGRPGYAFLILACDLPFLDTKTLEHLIQNRRPEKLATSFRSHHDGLPEPLCAIWEPHGEKFLQQKREEDMRCPRKILIQGETHLLDLPNQEALDNINTPEDYMDALARMDEQN
jgi:molybdopterin-guanine dinucleotide biosynthesis protein A